MTCMICAKHTCMGECMDRFLVTRDETKIDLIFRLKERARIRRQIPGRKSVQEGKPDRIADLLEEAAKYIEENT